MQMRDVDDASPPCAGRRRYELRRRRGRRPAPAAGRDHRARPRASGCRRHSTAGRRALAGAGDCRWTTSGCCRRCSRRPSGTSSPSRSTSRACAAASTGPAGSSASGTRRRRSTSPTRTPLIGAARRRAGSAGLRAAATSSSRSPPSSAATAPSLTPEQARDHIFGYTIFNDWSARDLQAPRDEGQPRARPRARTSPPRSGPWLVTADELEPYRDADGFLALDCAVAVNGVEIGQDLLSNMGWPFEELIAYASRGTWVRAGRRARLGHLRQRRLPGRAVGPPRPTRPAAAAARRRRRDDRRGHRHHPQPGGARRSSCRRCRPARPRPRPASARS